MTKSAPIAFRITPELKRKIERAAAADHRSTSSLITTILAHWVDGRSYPRPAGLPDPDAPADPAPLRKPVGRPRSSATRGKSPPGQHHLAPWILPMIAGETRVNIEEMLDRKSKTPREALQPGMISAIGALLHELGWAAFIEEDGTAEGRKVWIAPSVNPSGTNGG